MYIGRCQRVRSSWPFMLSFRDGRCDAKDGVAADRQSLRACWHLSWDSSSEYTVGSLSTREWATLHAVKRDTRFRGTKTSFSPVTRVKWPARSTVAAGGSGAVKINRMASCRIALSRRPSWRAIHLCCAVLAWPQECFALPLS